MDKETLLPVECETWQLNLTHANMYDETEWKQEYSLIDEYGLKDLSPASFMQLANKIFLDESTAQRFQINWHGKNHQ